MLAPLTDADRRFLRESRSLPKDALVATETRDGWQLQAGPFVGVFSLPTLTVQVRPKAEIGARNLLYMLARAARIGLTLLPTAPLALDRTDLQEDLARLFLLVLSRQLERGIMRRYQLVQENAQALRGRLRVAAYLRRTDPARLPIEYGDLTANHPVNWLFLHTLNLLARNVRAADNRRQVALLRGWLLDAGVGPLREQPRRDPAFDLNRLSRRFQEALNLAWLLLEGYGALQDSGSHHGQAFTFDMDRLYEKFLEQVILKDVLPGTGYTGRAQTLDGTERHLFQGGVQELKPDLTISSGGKVQLIVDFKNKPVNHQLDRGDLYQMYAYARHLDCPRVLLLYPGTGETRRTLTTTRAPSIHVTAATLDLTRLLPQQLDALKADLWTLLRHEGLTL